MLGSTGSGLLISVNAAVINRQQRITYRIFFILSSYRMHKKEGHEKGLLTVSCT